MSIFLPVAYNTKWSVCALISEQVLFLLLITGILAILEAIRDFSSVLQVSGTLINFVLGILIFLLSLSSASLSFCCCLVQYLSDQPKQAISQKN